MTVLSAPAPGQVRLVMRCTPQEARDLAHGLEEYLGNCASVAALVRDLVTCLRDAASRADEPA